MNLGKEDIPKLEQFFRKYNDLKGQLAYRRYELLYQPSDSNIGGGKSNLPSSPVENEIVKLHKDIKYCNLQATIQAIEDVYNKATPEQKFIIEHRYWEQDLLIYEWQDIAHELTKKRKDDKIISQYSVIRMRNQIMRMIAERIGWIHFD
ncbi:transcriptional regulator [Staphylococcus gallinarum]|uniref:transcriptional regulator n=1 Tax=Staphylococcus gallinarum TaxID=1293 RepID=UPI000D1F7C0A|nr:transcriptional regulator [Staphylococcus gallinarum]MBU7217864.1 transcriptional regulator [Staphylococcus gallinarum]MCD8921685.1 transcriptional regulator [Staphylococcus gallinarum]PTK95474.1 transcriptional regulator [Staphylococcus gallinarum]PTK96379.1 transcriptional regulator [Staphylococcus gallinarum]PTL07819.1 transcriptional regulator [Staphylococcus gallinarum]